jgi:Autotransporter beta-domain
MLQRAEIGRACLTRIAAPAMKCRGSGAFMEAAIGRPGTRPSMCARHASVLGAALAALIGIGGGQALASAGCNAVNAGGFNASANGVQTARSIPNFAVGDTITFVITITVGGWTLSSGNNTILAVTAVSATQSYTVTGRNIDTTLGELLGPTATVTATCVAAAPPAAPPTNPSGASTTNTDSLNVRILQIAATKTAATMSGDAITGAVNGAIGDAFSNGGNPVTVSPNGIVLKFTGEAQRDPRVEEAFEALGYAATGRKALRPAYLPEREWDVWLDVRGTGFRQNEIIADTHGDQINATAGIARKLTPYFLLGVVTGYEHFNYDVVSLAGTLKGSGGTVGGYAAWRLAPTLRWDATVAWSDIAYNATAGTATGSFTGHRWIASTGLTGDYHLAAYIIEPSTNLYALWERQGDWFDSLGTLQTARSFSAGRIATGGKLIYPWFVGATRVAPYLGAYGDWRFASDNAFPAGLPIVGIGNGWSGRVTGGLALTCVGGGTLTLGSEYGGLGASYKVWTANARVLWPF